MAKTDYESRPYRACVGIVLMNRAGEVFAGRRVDHPEGHWQMPQGGIDEFVATGLHLGIPVIRQFCLQFVTQCLPDQEAVRQATRRRTIVGLDI